MTPVTITKKPVTARRDELDLRAKYELENGEVFLTGLQALVRVPLDQMRADRRAGLNTSTFISGYPGSPLAGLDKELHSNRELLESLRIRFQPGLNEELAATAVMGSQLASKHLTLRGDGVVGIWYAKAPGLDRSADAVRHANFIGVPRTGGVLAYIGDDPGSKSSTLPSSSEHLLADLYMPVLSPGSVQEVIDLGVHGVALSRASSLWTGIKVVTAVADGAGSAVLDPARVVPVIPVDDDGRPYGRATTTDIGFAAFLDAEREIHETRLSAARAYAAVNGLNTMSARSSADWIGLVVPGSLYGQLMHGLSELGISPEDLPEFGVRVLKLGMIWPIDGAAVRDFAEGLDEIVVVEERKAFLETLVRDTLYGHANAPRVLGKLDDQGVALIPHYGSLDGDAIGRALRRRLVQRLGDRLAPEPPAPAKRGRPIAIRTPYFCSGCPHNTSTRVPDDAVVGTGIGCHGMIGFMDPERVGKIASFTQMGGEGAQWVGIAPFVEESHFFQNVGDGTFFHSGQLAVQQAVAAGVNVTFKILDNRAVAMTGGQDPTGQLSPQAIAAQLQTQGVKRVIITTDDTAAYRRVKLPARGGGVGSIPPHRGTGAARIDPRSHRADP